MPSKPVLYSFYRSTCTWRVRIVLALKKIDYEFRAVNLLLPMQQQNSREFQELNAMSQVPVLVVDGKPISQSVAIMEYLEETYPEPRTLPADPYLRAKTREIVELVVSGMQPLQSVVLIPKLGEAEWRKWSNHYITKGFKALEAILAQTAGKYCVGDEVTLADACLVPQVYNAVNWDIDLKPFPTIMRIYAALESHPLLRGTHPSCQPDTPSNNPSKDPVLPHFLHLATTEEGDREKKTNNF